MSLVIKSCWLQVVNSLCCLLAYVNRPPIATGECSETHGNSGSRGSVVKVGRPITSKNGELTAGGVAVHSPLGQGTVLHAPQAL